MSSDEATPRTWPDNAWPTAAELADWLSRCTSAERLDYAAHSLATAQDASRCVMQRHEDAIRDAQEAGRRLASQRDDLIAQGANPRDLLVPVGPLDWDDPEWGGRIHHATTDDLGDHGHHSDETNEDD